MMMMMSSDWLLYSQDKSPSIVSLAHFQSEFFRRPNRVSNGTHFTVQTRE